MQALEPPRADAASGAESAWERGLRQAKEVINISLSLIFYYFF